MWTVAPLLIRQELTSLSAVRSAHVSSLELLGVDSKVAQQLGHPDAALPARAGPQAQLTQAQVPVSQASATADSTLPMAVTKAAPTAAAAATKAAALPETALPEKGMAAVSSQPSSDLMSSTDPRWDAKGFHAFVQQSAPFLRVQHLRTRSTGETVPESEFERSVADAGIEGRRLFAVLSASLADSDSVEEAEEQEALRRVLFGEAESNPAADEDDLVFWPRLCMPDDCDRTQLYRMFTYYRVQTIILPVGKPNLFQHLETMAYLALTAFSQRITNVSDKKVKAGLDFTRLVDLPKTLIECRDEEDALKCRDDDTFQRIATTMDEVFARLPHLHISPTLLLPAADSLGSRRAPTLPSMDETVCCPHAPRVRCRSSMP